MPANTDWLAQLVAGFSYGPREAGVTGRHCPHPGQGKFLERDFKNNFDNFRNLGSVLTFEDPLPSTIYPGGIEWQSITMFYSDNNSAMSRAVWKEIPYPEIDWGEDKMWAWEVLKLGFQKVYQDKAPHNIDEELRRMNERDRFFVISNRVSAKDLEHQLRLNEACLLGRAEGQTASKSRNYTFGNVSATAWSLPSPDRRSLRRSPS